MKREKCLNKKINEEDCTCENKTCERHDICCLCIRHHKDSGSPACLR